MAVKEGYIAIADPNWIKTCMGQEMIQVNYWIRRKVFKAVPSKSPIFFLEKGTRLVRGFGKLGYFGVSTVLESWNHYGRCNGANTYDDFLGMLNCSEDNATSQEIGNLFINDVVWASTEIPIDSTAINFPKPTVSGKRIDLTESELLISLVGGNTHY